MFKIFAGLAALAIVAGCAEQPTTSDQRAADYGRAIPQSECVSIARRELQTGLKDPATAKLQFGTCSKRALNSIPIYGLPKQYGYYIPVSVNAKNSFGGYTGAQQWGFLIKDGRAIRRLHPSDGYMLPY